MSSEYVLFGIENPLLDISAVVNAEFLAKYGLDANNAVLANDAQKPIYEDLVKSFSVEYVAGGAAQNTLRGAQYLLPPKSTVYVGCVGKDAYADQLRSAAAADGLRTEYMVDESTPTGRCAVLITGHHRSLCTDLLAANNYKFDHLKKPEIWSLVENAKFYYVGGYFLTVSPESANAIAEHVTANRVSKGKRFMLNLSAPFIPQFFKAPLDALLPHTDVLFGNEAEAVSYAESHGLAELAANKDIAGIAKAIAELPRGPEDAGAPPRMVVFTQGRDPTLVAIAGEAEVQSFPVHAVEESKIVDTNGAGDGFCGGFLAGWVRGLSIEKCVHAGQYLAALVIQRSGPTYPKEASDYMFE
ncbi:Ribokinase-like protein [Zopfochytrium polystomum]|nr:Ribokinase-like protein [Zopfochytrium polystomum]